MGEVRLDGGKFGQWPSKRGPMAKIRRSDGCGRDAVPLAVERRYDFPEFGGYLGNVRLEEIESLLCILSRIYQIAEN